MNKIVQEQCQDKSWIPPKAHFTLMEACTLKGLNYKTSCNRTILQPNAGEPDGYIGGRKVFRRDTIIKWLNQYDNCMVLPNSDESDETKLPENASSLNKYIQYNNIGRK